MDRAQPEPVLSTWLSILVYAASAAALVLPVAVLSAVFSAAICAALGTLIGRRVARSTYRLTAIWGLLLVAFVVVLVLRAFLLSSPWLASLLGPTSFLRWTDTLFFGASALIIALALRTSVLRRRTISVLEVALISLAFAYLVVAHRNGAINRPFELADPIIAMGGDPTIALLIIGGLTAFVIILVLLKERSVLRSFLHLTVAAALIVLLLYATRSVGLPQPPLNADTLGLRSDSDDKGQGKGGKGRDKGGRRRNDELDFKDNFENPSGNRIPVAVVLLHDDYSSPNGLYYFRQNAFSQYNGRKLVSATRNDVDQDLIKGFPSSRTIVAEVPNAKGDRATLDTTVALLADHKQPFALESPIAIEPAPNPDPGRFRRIYRATSAALTSDLYTLLEREVGNPDWSPAQREHYLQAPKDPRYAELAQQIVNSIIKDHQDNDFLKAIAVITWLSREGIYSLRSRHAHAEDPAADFLFGDRTGYCVHFAHAAVYLMRTLGLPSRIATGYVVEEAARRGGSTIVLAGENSHAWPEIYLNDVGWVIVDVSPERFLDPPPRPPDPDLQRLLGEMVRGQKPLPQDFGRPFQKAAKVTREIAMILGYVVLCSLLLGLTSLYLIKSWRRLIPLISRDRSLPRLRYRAELDRLSEIQLTRRFGESRERFASRIQSISPSFTSLTQIHIASVFGASDVYQPERVRELTICIKNELRTHISWWRRFLGLFIPWSWLNSR